jgi:ketosteroid isomerase-like protein
MKQDRLFDSAIGTRSLSDWAAFFTEDGVMIRTEVGEISGPAEIQGAIFEAAQARALTRFRWAPERAEVSLGGDMGYTVGSYWTTGEDDAGIEVAVSGKYVTIWRIQEDGTWLAEMTLGVPLTGPEPAPLAEEPEIIGRQWP